MSTTRSPLIERYLADLRAALREMPRRQRDELVAEIEAHIDQTVPDGASDAEVLTALDRMGDPEQIAAAERERLGIEPATSGWLEWLAIPLLLVGGIVIPVVGWVIGVVFLWLSRCWTTRDKLLATLLVPGGLAPALYMTLAPAYTESCRTSVSVGPNGRTGPTTHCTGGASTPVQIGLVLLMVVLVIAPIYTAVRLGRRLPPSGRSRRAFWLPGRASLALLLAGAALGGAAVWFVLSTRPPGHTARVELLSGVATYVTPDGSQFVFHRDRGNDSAGFLDQNNATALFLSSATTFEDCHGGGCTPQSSNSCLPGGSRGWQIDIGLALITIPNGVSQPQVAWVRCWGPG